MPVRIQTGVYCWRNKVNGKRYVGSTSMTFAERKRGHLKGLRKGSHKNALLQNAWNKHGEEAFIFEVLHRCSPEECVAKEQEFIDAFRSAERGFGYNLSPTAGSTLGLKFKNSDATRANQSRGRQKFWDDHPDLKQKQAETLAERNRSPEMRRISSERKVSPLERLRLQEAMRKRHLSPGYSQRISRKGAAALIRKNTEEGRSVKQVAADMANLKKACEASKKRSQETTGSS